MGRALSDCLLAQSKMLAVRDADAATLCGSGIDRIWAASFAASGQSSFSIDECSGLGRCVNSRRQDLMANWLRPSISTLSCADHGGLVDQSPAAVIAFPRRLLRPRRYFERALEAEVFDLGGDAPLLVGAIWSTVYCLEAGFLARRSNSYLDLRQAASDLPVSTAGLFPAGVGGKTRCGQPDGDVFCLCSSVCACRSLILAALQAALERAAPRQSARSLRRSWRLRPRQTFTNVLSAALGRCRASSPARFFTLFFPGLDARRFFYIIPATIHRHLAPFHRHGGLLRIRERAGNIPASPRPSQWLPVGDHGDLSLARQTRGGLQCALTSQNRTPRTSRSPQALG